ncbi:MAG: tRNA lysidine(34) synthetase TilS [Gammaproteobacteria bacterium]|nr:tRNA lysidine(34) synthetase TilS [Gammaproteobacteria bacterium]
MTFSVDHLRVFLQNTPAQAYCVAYSGGLDSTVLLHACVQLGLTPLRAIHIHHGLSQHADDWAQHCQQQAQLLGIECVVQRVNLNLLSGESVEAQAREARYAAFAHLLQTHEALLTAHHLEDQAETVLLQLLRGSGPAGLAAMAAQSQFAKGYLLRPLLTQARADLQRYAQQLNVSWVEDDSNSALRFDRNYVRHQVWPLFTARWPSAATSVARSAQWMAEADSLLNELAAQDLSTLLSEQGLAIAPLQQLNEPRQRNVLRYWLQQAQLAVPGHAQLASLLQQLDAASDRQIEINWRGGRIRRYQQHLVADANAAMSEAPFGIWQLQENWPLGEGRVLRREDLLAAGLRIPPEIQQLQVAQRQGGERIHLQGHAHRHSLKKLLQTRQIPPWQRDQLLLLFHQQTLVAVWGMSPPLIGEWPN